MSEQTEPTVTAPSDLAKEMLDRLGVTANRTILNDILTTSLLLATDTAEELNLKITRSALDEMRNAFRLFAQYRDRPKVSIFGSARTKPDDPLYGQAKLLAEDMAQQGWMVVTGAGPGIMSAGIEGAGAENSIGVSIRLPFEQATNHLLDDGTGVERLVSMKYFFTRKLMLIKESAAFVSLPGGFGTLDETFELLTLVQTGKSTPAPIVFLDVPGGSYWASIARFVREELISRGLVSDDDDDLYLVTDDVHRARQEILRFYDNYDSLRYVGDRLVIRLRRSPTPAQLDDLNQRFGALCREGRIETAKTSRAEREDADKVDLPRIALRFDQRRYGLFRSFINALNDLPAVDPG
ncbi:MAG: TIGR00730 family Rossman fold protein [Acidimicrobiia bacterium]